MPDITTAEGIATAIGGGVTGVLGLWLYLMITKRLGPPTDTSFFVGEIDKRDKTIADERAYSKQVVSDLQELNRSVREDVVPAMTTMNQQTVVITTILQQEITNRARQN